MQYLRAYMSDRFHNGWREYDHLNHRYRAAVLILPKCTITVSARCSQHGTRDALALRLALLGLWTRLLGTKIQ